METIESISAEEWEQLVGEFIDREAEGFDELPASTLRKWSRCQCLCRFESRRGRSH